MKLTKESEVRLHNHLAEARYKLNPSEQKIFIYAVSLINQEKKNFNEVEFTLSELATATGMNYDRLSRDIKSIAKNIIETSIEAKDPEEPDDWTFYSLATKCRHIKREGRIQFKFNEEMKPLLLDLQKHYFIQAPEVIKFKSFHSIRLYDFFRAKAHKETEWNTTIDESKELLDLVGKYKTWKDYKKCVIEPAVEEINTSDLHVSYQMRKRGRGAYYLDFKFETINQQTTNAFKNGATKFKSVVTDIREYIGDSISDFLDGQIYEFYCLALIHEPVHEDAMKFISRTIDYMNRPMAKPVKNPYSYLKKSLEEGYVYGQMTLDIE